MNYPTVSCWIIEEGCKVDWSAAPAWIQAILSVAAIWWASKNTMSQVAKQHHNDIKLRDEEATNKQIILLTAMYERISNIENSINSFIARAHQATQESASFDEFEKRNYINAFQDFFDDLVNLSIYNLSSAEMIKIHVFLRFEIRQIQFNTNKFMERKGFFTEQHRGEFVESIQGSLNTLELCKTQIDVELTRLKRTLGSQ